MRPVSGRLMARPAKSQTTDTSSRSAGWTSRDFVKRLFLAFYAICGVLIVAEVVFGKATEHPHPYEGPFGFYAVYGFISFWFLVLLAKPMRKLLIRSEDYYEREGSDDAE